MRLIDITELIKAIEAEDWDTVSEKDMLKLLAIITEQHQTEVINCEHCTHRKRQFGKQVYCQLVSNVMPPDGFCSLATGKRGSD